MAGKKVYAVRNGRTKGIFMTWAECQKQVNGFAGARFKSFTDASEAVAWLQAPEDPSYGKRRTGKQQEKTVLRQETQDDDMADYLIYTDGSCLRNPDGPGGWAFVAFDYQYNQQTERAGGNRATTNNRMELTAALEALRFARRGSTVDLYTDSQYLKNAYTKHWLANWQRRGWKTATGSPVKNQDLWEALAEQFDCHQVRFHWVKGHVGIEYNERCDRLAKAQAVKFS